MRFDIPVYFQLIKHGEYDPKTGDYADGEPVETLVYANVTETGTDALSLIYGELRQDSKVIRLQSHYKNTFNRIRIGDKQYRVDFERKLRVKHVFVVSEVQ